MRPSVVVERTTGKQATETRDQRRALRRQHHTLMRRPRWRFKLRLGGSPGGHTVAWVLAAGRGAFSERMHALRRRARGCMRHAREKLHLARGALHLLRGKLRLASGSLHPRLVHYLSIPAPCRAVLLRARGRDDGTLFVAPCLHAVRRERSPRPVHPRTRERRLAVHHEQLERHHSGVART